MAQISKGRFPEGSDKKPICRHLCYLFFTYCPNDPRYVTTTCQPLLSTYPLLDTSSARPMVCLGAVGAIGPRGREGANDIS